MRCPALVAVTDAVRSPPSSSAISPNIAPGSA
jgi:hypothetical protein